MDRASCRAALVTTLVFLGLIFAMSPGVFGAMFYNSTARAVDAQFSPLECGEQWKFHPSKMAGGNWCLNDLYLQKGDNWSSVNSSGWFRVVELPGANLSGVVECKVDRDGWVIATIEGKQLVLTGFSAQGIRQCRETARF